MPPHLFAVKGGEGLSYSKAELICSELWLDERKKRKRIYF